MQYVDDVSLSVLIYEMYKDKKHKKYTYLTKNEK